MQKHCGVACRKIALQPDIIQQLIVVVDNCPVQLISSGLDDCQIHTNSNDIRCRPIDILTCQIGCGRLELVGTVAEGDVSVKSVDVSSILIIEYQVFNLHRPAPAVPPNLCATDID